jgi:serine/threonine protein phosphatase PrpC
MMEIVNQNSVVKWEAAGSSIQGKSHVSKNIPCQDYVHFELKNECLTVALADGAGSAKHSDIGAKIATVKTCRQLSKNFEFFFKAEADVVRAKIIHVLRTNLGIQAKIKEARKRDFASTLIFVAIKNNRFIAGHIGDGLLGCIEYDRLSLMSPPENGEFVNQTYFTTSKNYQRYLRLFKGDLNNVTGFVLMSDGTGESLFDKQNNILAPIVKDVIKWLDNNPPRIVNEAIRSNLKEIIRENTTDDCSLAIIRKIEKEKLKLPRTKHTRS